MIEIDKTDRKLICELAEKSFSVSFEIWAYGSRVDGSHHEGSDLDIVIRGQDLKALPIAELVDFKERLKESNIPILIDVFDWSRLPDAFHQNILKKYEVLFSNL